MPSEIPPANSYVLGHSSEELERLIAQGRFFGDLAEHFLRQAGIRDGMRVRDLGCGAGDVAFLAARLVGPTGAVLGIDRSAESIAAASRRAQAAGLSNVAFAVCDAAEFTTDTPLDGCLDAKAQRMTRLG